MLQLINVEMVYVGVILVLKGVSLEVPEESIVALLGANGAGKTSTLKCISGLEHSEEGEVTRGYIKFMSHRIEKMDPTSIYRLGIVQVLEGRKVLEHLSVTQNLVIGSILRSDKDGIKRDMDLVFELFPALKGKRNSTAGYLSGGEQQMLVVGRALMASPKIMLLDEPSLGIAPILVQEIFKNLKTINKEKNIAMLLVEQNAQIALSISQQGYVIENGRIVLQGKAEELRNNEDIKEFYMGMSLTGQRKSYREVKHYKRRKRWLG